MTLLKILGERGFFPPFFHLVTYKQELDIYENVLYKLEMLKATYWLASLSLHFNVHSHTSYNHRAHELLLEEFIVEGNETINLQAVC